MALEIEDIRNDPVKYRKISRQFKDISLSFTRNPVTNDIIVLKNEDAIKKSVVNLVRTRLGERFFNDLLGTSVSNTLFENAGPEIYGIESEIDVLLKNFEPRVANGKTKVTHEEDSNDLLVRIEYDIVGIDAPRQELEFILQPTRI
mgnify:CR=1 FL=1|jgi:phage baseplate assembly protein W|tara:strand:- start:4320 stop:4757 length:438 start_codon:yes stop_codon:yes gene_type:complete